MLMLMLIPLASEEGSQDQMLSCLLNMRRVEYDSDDDHG